MNFKKRVNGSWVDTPHYIHNTSTDTITTLPTDLYADGNNATVGLKGNLYQSGTPTPSSPIYPSETGDKTANLFDKSMADLYSHSTLGQTNTWAYSVESTGTTLRIPCDANTQYTLSIGSTIGNTIFRISEISTDDVPIEGGSGGIVCHTILNGGAINNYTFTTASDSRYILFQINANVMTATLNTLMLNLGSTPLPYEPYGIKIPISSAGQTTSVYLGEVQSTRQIAKYEFTGQETWAKPTETSSFQTGIVNNYLHIHQCSVICSHFKSIVNLNIGETLSENECAFYAPTGTNAFYIKKPSWTLQEFKTYLQQQYAAGTPVTIWYVLAEPSTGIVNEPLRKIGNYVDTVSGISIPTITGTDSLDVLTTLKPSEVSLTYHGWHPVSSAHERSGGSWT